MRIVFDTTVLVDVDRGKEDTLRLLEAAQAGGHEMWLSTVTLSETFTGSHLRRDAEAATSRAREVLAQFEWKDLDGEVALRTGQVLAHLVSHGRKAEYQDAAIAATALVLRADILVTDNGKHFAAIPGLEGMVTGTKAARGRLEK